MATVTKNPNGTFTLALTAKEERTLARAGNELSPPLAPAPLLKKVLDRTLSAWLDDHLAADGPTRLTKFASLAINKQDVIDTLLNGG